MAGKETISNSQFTILTIMFIIGGSTLIAPPLIALDAKQDSWLSSLIGTGCGLLLVNLYGILAKRDPEHTLVEFTTRVLGRKLGRLVSFIYFLFFLFLTAVLLRIVGDFMTTLVLPETPIQAIEIAFGLTVIMGVRLGLEAFARTSEMLLPWVVMFFVLLLLFLAPEIKLNNFAPVMENGLEPVLKGVMPLLGIPFLDLVILLMLTPSVTHPRKTGKNMTVGVICGGLLLMMVSSLCITVLGPKYTASLNFPTYELVQKVDIGHFIQRIEGIAGGIMFISIFFKITICYYGTVLCLAHTLSLNQYKFLTYPIGMLVIVFSLIVSPNLIYFHNFVRMAWTPLCLVLGLLFPTLLLIADLVRVGRNKPQESG